MRILILAISLLFPFFDSFGQNVESYTRENSVKLRRAKAIYFEVLGSSGLDYSINYDMRFKPGRKGWGFRAAITRPSQVGQTEIFSFPLLVNFLQSDRRFSFEGGAGFIVNYKKLTFEDSNFIIQRRQSIQLPAVATIGFRFQPLKTGLVWRVYWAPTWRIGEPSSTFYPYWFGTSLGIGLIEIPLSTLSGSPTVSTARR